MLTVGLQVLSAYKALHALPEVLCKANALFGTEAIRDRTQKEISKYTNSILNLESSRLLHQRDLSQLLTVDSGAQLEITTQVRVRPLAQIRMSVLLPHILRPVEIIKCH